MLRVGGVLLILFVGMWIGAASKDPPVEYRVRTETVTETVTKEVAVPASFPLACQQLLNYAERLSEAGIGIDAAATRQLDLLSRARLAILRTDMNEINRIDTAVRGLEQITVGHAQDISEIKNKYPAVLHECKEKSEWQTN